MIHDVGVGRAFAKARYLDTETHGFLSPDPMIYKLPEFYLLDPQQMNSYSYARNNPVMYTDPSGEIPFLLPILGAFTGGFSFGYTLGQNKTPDALSYVGLIPFAGSIKAVQTANEVKSVLPALSKISSELIPKSWRCYHGHS